MGTWYEAKRLPNVFQGVNFLIFSFNCLMLTKLTDLKGYDLCENQISLY
jgi:hypothetical protein